MSKTKIKDGVAVHEISIRAAKELARESFLKKFEHEYVDVPLIRRRNIRYNVQFQEEKFVRFRLADFIKGKFARKSKA